MSPGKDLMKHEIPHAGWPQKLADTIIDAQGGDTIICHTAAMVELAERARARLTPGKQLHFEVEEVS